MNKVKKMILIWLSKLLRETYLKISCQSQVVGLLDKTIIFGTLSNVRRECFVDIMSWESQSTRFGTSKYLQIGECESIQQFQIISYWWQQDLPDVSVPLAYKLHHSGRSQDVHINQQPTNDLHFCYAACDVRSVQCNRIFLLLHNQYRTRCLLQQFPPESYRYSYVEAWQQIYVKWFECGEWISFRSEKICSKTIVLRILQKQKGNI